MTLNKVLRYVILIGIFATVFIPLIVSGSMFFPFITGKNFIFRIIVEIMVGLWLVLAYRDKEARPQRSWILIALTIYLLISTLATIFGTNPTHSFWSNFERMEGLLGQIHVYLFFLITVSVLKTREIWRRLFQTSLAVSVYISIYSFLQLMGKFAIHQSATRLDATLGNSAYLAVYILFHIFLSAYLLTTSKNKFANWIYGLITGLEIIILYYTETRGTQLGLIGGLVLIAILTAIYQRDLKRRIAIVFLAIIVVLGVGFFALKDTSLVQSNRVLARYTSLLNWNGFVNQPRFMIWNMSLQGFKEHPVLGWGQENYLQVFQKYYVPEMYGQEPWFDRSHNIILDNLINAGILGFLSYLFIFLSALYYLWRLKNGNGEDDRIPRLIFIGLLAAYFFQNITVFDNLVSSIMFMLVLGLIHTLYGREELARNVEPPAPVKFGQKNKNDNRANQPEDLTSLVIVVAIIISAGSLYYFSVRGVMVSQTLIRALSSRTPEEQLANYEKIFKYKTVTGQTEAREQFLNSTLSVIGNPSPSNEIKNRFFQLATTEMDKQFALDPNDSRQRLFYGSFLIGLGQMDKGIAELELARQLSPRKQVILFQLGSAYLGLGKNEQALTLIKQAYDSEPNYNEARRMYALVLYYTGNTALADQILGSDPLPFINDDRFIGYYSSVGRHDKVVQIWQERLKEDPAYKPSNISLAQAYNKAGNRAAAIGVLEDYVKIDPAFATEAQTLIDKIKTGQWK